jgi:hypothetical protein
MYFDIVADLACRTACHYFPDWMFDPPGPLCTGGALGQLSRYVIYPKLLGDEFYSRKTNAFAGPARRKFSGNSEPFEDGSHCEVRALAGQGYIRPVFHSGSSSVLSTATRTTPEAGTTSQRCRS